MVSNGVAVVETVIVHIQIFDIRKPIIKVSTEAVVINVVIINGNTEDPNVSTVQVVSFAFSTEVRIVPVTLVKNVEVSKEAEVSDHTSVVYPVVAPVYGTTVGKTVAVNCTVPDVIKALVDV